MKKIVSLLIAVIMVLGMTPALAEDVVSKVMINGEIQSFTALNGFVPLRAFSEAVDTAVIWDNEAKCAVCIDGGVEIKIPVGQKWIQRAGLKQSVEKESVIINDLTYIHLSALKAFNASYGGDESIVTIEKSAFDGKFVKIINNGKALSSDEAGSNVVMLDVKEDEAQIWKFTARGSEAYRLANKKTNKAIDVPSDSKDAGKTLIQYAFTGGGNQNYVPVRSVDGTYNMQCYNSKLFMTIAPDGTVTQEELTNAENQKFTLEVVQTGEAGSEDAVTPDTPLPRYEGKFIKVNDSIYKLMHVGDEKYLRVNKATGKYQTLDTQDTDKKEAALVSMVSEKTDFVTLSDVNYGESTFVGGKLIKLVMDGKSLMVNEANEIVLSDEQGDIAAWEAVALSSEYFTLINKETGKAIDVPNESKEAGIKLSQYTSNKKNHQVYSFEKADGGIRLKNRNSEMYLTIKEGIAYQEAKAESGQVFTYEVVGESATKMVAITRTPFILKGDEAVTNVKLQWNEVISAKSYDIYRSVDGNEYELIDSLKGFTTDDYDLEIGKSYTYRVYALDDNGMIGYAETVAFTPYELPLDMKSTTNLEPSGMSTPSKGMRDAAGLYYKFTQKSRTDGGKGFGWMEMTTSEDNITYSEPKVVLTIEDILAHETCKSLDGVRFESVNIRYNPKADNFGFIAHAEPGGGGYDFARISIATYTPGDEKMVFHGAVRPGGDDVRDLNTFIDDDGTTYIMGATHNNADLAIYRLKDDWSGVEKRVALLNPGAWRELPNILKVDNYYYLFTSGCAGWYPTPGMYNSATNMEGPWSELRNVGNLTTFSSQSGYGFYLKADSTNYIMNSYRWMNYWKDATVKTTQSLRLPITVSNGYAFYDYFEELLYNWDEDVLAPVQRGRNLSQNKPTSYGKNANDGNYKSQWSVDTKWPYSWEVDLGQVYNVNQVQISWLLRIGSEPYYNYIIEGSEDGVNYKTLVDKSKGYTDYGFTVDNCQGKARFVRVTVNDAKPRSGSNNFPSTFYEIKVFGR
ncbi:MAG: RICIN domain-containing protein [Clostridia bacterium]|nr:RICIN domain-containing protein [Clostridia bacterium]